MARPSRAKGTGRQSARKKGGKPVHRPTKQTRSDVAGMVSSGATHAIIAKMLGLAPDTLRRHYATELDAGRELITAELANTLVQKARRGDNTALIFWLKTKAGYRETSEVAHTGDVVIEVKRGRADGSATVETVGASVTPAPEGT